MGACRIPALNPDEVVALGAAVQANILGGGSEITKEMLLLDVTPLSLGIEVAGGVTDKIILRNSTIPASATQYYTTQVDGQTNVAIHVLQGERELARDCRSLARFDLKGVPPMAAGMPRIEVKFLIDANGILRVSAREQRSGQGSRNRRPAQLRPHRRASREHAARIFRLCRGRFPPAPGDRSAPRSGYDPDGAAKARRIRPGRNSPATNARTSKLEKALVAVKDGDDYHAIREAIDALNQATMRLAELMMDTAVSTALKGKAMDDSRDRGRPAGRHPVAKADFE